MTMALGLPSSSSSTSSSASSRRKQCRLTLFPSTTTTSSSTTSLLFLLITFIGTIPTIHSQTINNDRVVEYDSCYEELQNFDTNGDLQLNEEEYFGFSKKFLGDSECWEDVDELPIELKAVFNQISCECRVRGGPPDCCFGDNANVPISGAAIGTRDIAEEQLYLRQACLRTDQAIISFCTPGPIFPIVVPTGPLAPGARAFDGGAILGMVVAGLLLLVLLLLCCCFCCGGGAAKKDDDKSSNPSEEDDEPESDEETGTRNVFDALDEESQATDRMDPQSREPVELASVPAAVLATQEPEELPKDPDEVVEEEEVIEEEEEKSEEEVIDDDTPMAESMPSPPPPAIPDTDDEEEAANRAMDGEDDDEEEGAAGGTAVRTLEGDEEVDDTDRRAIYAVNPDDAKNEDMKLRPIERPEVVKDPTDENYVDPTKERTGETYGGQWEYNADGGVHRPEREGEWEYNADGGWNPEERQGKAPTEFDPKKYQRAVIEAPVVVDNRKQRHIEALGDAAIFDLLGPEHDAVAKDVEPDDWHDWIIPGALETLDLVEDQLKGSFLDEKKSVDENEKNEEEDSKPPAV